MLEPMKKHHIKNIELSFIGPADKKQDAIDCLKKLGFVDISENVPWTQCECFARFKGNETGAVLRGARQKEDLTQKQLAELTGIPQRHISEMENGKRPIGKKNAKKFAEVLKIDYRVFL
ncbi:helix-turn-helix domain-containing protein [Desulfonauticus submarinus]